MDAIVPPNNTSLVTHDDDHHHHGYGYRDDKYCEILDRISTAAENIMNNDNANAHHNSATAERLGLAGIAATDRNGIDTRGNVDRNGMEGRGNTDRNGLEGRQLVREEGHEARQLVRAEGLEGRQLTREEGHEIRHNLWRIGDSIERFGMKNFDATKDALKDVLLQNCHNTDKIICNDNLNYRDIKDKLCNIELNQAKDTAAIQLEAAKNTAAIQLEASKNKCAIELDAAKHAAELAKQLAECCCEQKALTIEKANETNALIREMDDRRVRDERDKLREELIALRIRSTLPPLPVASVPI